MSEQSNRLANGIFRTVMPYRIPHRNRRDNRRNRQIDTPVNTESGSLCAKHYPLATRERNAQNRNPLLKCQPRQRTGGICSGYHWGYQPVQRFNPCEQVLLICTKTEQEKAQGGGPCLVFHAAIAVDHGLAQREVIDHRWWCMASGASAGYIAKAIQFPD